MAVRLQASLFGEHKATAQLNIRGNKYFKSSEFDPKVRASEGIFSPQDMKYHKRGRNCEGGYQRAFRNLRGVLSKIFRGPDLGEGCPRSDQKDPQPKGFVNESLCAFKTESTEQRQEAII